MTPGIEDELRRAMAGAVDGVAAPPGLAARVRARHRRRTVRIRVATATAAVAVLGVVAVPLVSAVDRTPPDVPSHPMGTPGTSARVDGVTLTYLPSGLRPRGREDRSADGDVRTVGRSWGAGDRTVSMDVLRGGSARSLNALRRNRWIDRPRAVRVPRGQAVRGVVPPSDGGGAELLWVVRPGLAVDLRAGSAYAGQMMRIAYGIRAPG